LLFVILNESTGFTVSLYEYEATIPTLWNAVKGQSIPCNGGYTFAKLHAEFIAANPGLVSPENAMDFLSDDGGETYNRCHCKSDS
jgi:alpha 1,2-mannosyltransferase